jgi:hypothetical protein
LRMLYKYPQREFPYTQLVQANRRRGRHEPEYELLDTAVFDDDRYFDVFMEYAKAAPDDILMRLTMHNRGPEMAEIHVLPQLWFRNTWSWSDVQNRPRLEAIGDGTIEADHPELGRFRCQVDPPLHWLFCDNETNPERVHGLAGVQGHFKDAFHEFVVHAWIADGLAGIDFGPEAATEEGRRRAEKGRAGQAAFKQYLAGLIEGWIREPGEGMISKMLHDDGPDGPMSPEEVLGNASLIFLAGHDSTVNLISHCVLTLLRNPWALELLRGRRDLIPRAIEEVLRLQSSVNFFMTRSALADIEIGGTVIPKGAPIFFMYGAANRDPRQFPNPNEFDLDRPDTQNVSWSSGIHTCFGGALARLEVNTAVEVFLRRVENPRLVVDPPPYRPNQFFRGPLHLEIDFDRIKD